MKGAFWRSRSEEGQYPLAMVECDLCYVHHSTFSTWLQSFCRTGLAQRMKLVEHEG
jgi:hypothetical protein